MYYRDEQRTEIPRTVTLVAGASGTAAGEGTFETMLTVALDGVIELSGAERGLVLIFDDSGDVLIEKARARERRDLDAPHLAVSRNVLEKVRSKGLPFWEESAATAVPDGALRHLLVASVPLHHEGRVCGLVYLDHSGAVLPCETLMLAQGLAQLVSVAAARGAERSWRWRCVDATRWSCN